MSSPGNLPMLHFLEVVAEYRTLSREVLLGEGYHHKVIYAKAVKAEGKGYTESGVVADRPWLTAQGEQFLSDARLDSK